MRKNLALVLIVIFLVLSFGSMVFAQLGPAGPAPNSGDCNPDGSGFDEPFGTLKGRGPAPNSGDGIPDGPGWE
ncbi:MAG: hypothetical protein GX432_00355 [Candidatus Atribacteria bacterium]|nr:hypothetical protein [Candidatus Atribacteria bacterium]